MATVYRYLMYPVVFCIAFCGTRELCAQTQAENTESSIESVLVRLKDRYGIDFIYKDFPDLGRSKAVYAQAQDSDYKQLLSYLRLFQEELRKYPAGFFKKRKLEAVVFVKKLFFKKLAVEGLYEHRRRIMMFDFLRSAGKNIAQRHNMASEGR